MIGDLLIGDRYGDRKLWYFEVRKTALIRFQYQYVLSEERDETMCEVLGLSMVLRIKGLYK